ncbi:MAG: FecR family protein [Bacteroidales bacterium]
MKENNRHNTNRFIRDKEFILSYYTGNIEQYSKDIANEYPELISELEEAIGLMNGIVIRKNGYTQEQLLEQCLRLENSIANNRDKKNKKVYIFITSGIAAMVAIFVTISLLVNPQLSESQIDELLSYDEITINSSYTQLFEEETLISSYKTEETIIEDNLDKPSDDKQLKLIVPYGKRAQLTLEDGTKLWVNAGSVLSYPSKFKENKREILLDGEVYIEVAKDEKRPFIIKSRDLAVKVLGTKFNFNSYSSLKEKSVTLLSGKVEIKNQQNDKITLKPNEHLVVNGNDQTISTVDANELMTWKEGYLLIKELNVSQILNKISHYYNIKIVAQTPLEDKCSGRLKLTTDPQDLMHMISQTAPVIFKKEGDVYYAYSSK